MCGVKNLSACVKIDVTPELVEPCLVLQQYFHVIVPAIQKFLIVRFYDVYMDLIEAYTKAMLTDAKFYQVLSTFVNLKSIEAYGQAH